MRTSSPISRKRRAQLYYGLLVDNSKYRSYYLEDLLIYNYGEPLELPKTLNEIIREGLLNDKGDINNY